MKCKMSAHLDSFITQFLTDSRVSPNIVSIFSKVMLVAYNLKVIHWRKVLLDRLHFIWNPSDHYPLNLYSDFFEILDEIVKEIVLRKD